MNWRVLKWCLATFLLAPIPARSECLPLKDFTDQVKAKYGEVPEVYAISDEMPIIIFVSPKTGTYTMVGIVSSGRMACTIGAGTNWRLTVEAAQQGDSL